MAKFKNWHLVIFLPLIFSLLGGIIGYFILKSMKNNNAKIIFWAGVAVFSLQISLLMGPLGFVTALLGVAMWYVSDVRYRWSW